MGTAVMTALRRGEVESAMRAHVFPTRKPADIRKMST
jgi:hypothetical protein